MVIEKTVREKWTTILTVLFSAAMIIAIVCLSLFYESPTDAIVTTKPNAERDFPGEGAQLYKIGIGIGDITGPAAETNMMGYANPSQITEGIHLRLYSRAYIVADYNDESQRFVFINADIGMGSQIVRLKLIERLEALYPGMYNDQNVAFSGQHTHSGPGGYQQYLLYDITSLGFVESSFQAILDGIEMSIQRAHDSLQPGYIYSNRGELVDPSGQDIHWANRNRSPFAYEANPQEERDKYDYDVDKTMTLLKFVAQDGQDLGLLSWFAVHPTSMNNTNHLISGDNKGYASYLMEQHFNDGARPGKGSFVAAFAQSNNGDVSPNTQDPHCLQEGGECEYETSRCPGQDVCVCFGPGEDMFESTEIIGRRQYERALELYRSALTPLSGRIGYKHQYIDMSSYHVTLSNGSTVVTCKPAMGYSFAGGTTDGPGALNFTQGDTTGDPFWDSVVDFLKPPTEELEHCHVPKPILLATGETNNPWDWHPTIVDTQILTIGQFVILAVPGEFSTMAGRRIRDSIKNVFVENGFESDGTEVVLAGLCNLYTHYIVTYEEYQVQRYEGASTIYGPHTLEAYQQQYALLAEAIATGQTLDPGPRPPNLYDDGVVRGLEFPVFVDDLPDDRSFGDVINDALPTYEWGDRVNVTFQAGNPRNDLKLEDTYLEVQRSHDLVNWETVYTDGDWCTRFYWISTSRRLVNETLQSLLDFLDDLPPFVPLPELPTALPVLPIPDNVTLPANASLPEIGIPGTGESLAEIIWEIPDGTVEGKYRICHYGNGIATVTERELVNYTGCSSPFDVIGKQKVTTSPVPVTVEDAAMMPFLNSITILLALVISMSINIMQTS
ncbi:putative neutral ceramidase C [Glandiceps talaboti]